MNKFKENDFFNLNYIKEFDIFEIDYSGLITYENAFPNMVLIETKFQELSVNKNCLKIIIDFRNTTWENQEVHDELSKIARKKYNNINYKNLYVAVLNKEYDSQTFANEHWFTQMEDAINWLIQKK
ncbi:MAG TPA: hypothetical protein PKY56_06155 [Candidatus Kapabacteria bacterium]|nr:hypothetical protein [Candidatus Kapabacteria bacterium]